MDARVMLPGRPFQIAAALALAGIIAGAFAGAREPVAVASAPVVAGTEFGSRWENLSAEEPPLMKKADRLALAKVEPVSIAAERVVPPPVKMAPVIMVQTKDDEDDKPVSRHRRRESNVCTRHNMHKVYTRGGRSWRCRR